MSGFVSTIGVSLSTISVSRVLSADSCRLWAFQPKTPYFKNINNQLLCFVLWAVSCRLSADFCRLWAVREFYRRIRVDYERFLVDYRRFNRKHLILRTSIINCWVLFYERILVDYQRISVDYERFASSIGGFLSTTSVSLSTMSVSTENTLF